MNALTHALALPLAERHGSDTLIHQIRVIISSSPIAKSFAKSFAKCTNSISISAAPFQMNTFLPKVTSGPDAQGNQTKTNSLLYPTTTGPVHYPNSVLSPPTGITKLPLSVSSSKEFTQGKKKKLQATHMKSDRATQTVCKQSQATQTISYRTHLQKIPSYTDMV